MNGNTINPIFTVRCFQSDNYNHKHIEFIQAEMQSKTTGFFSVWLKTFKKLTNMNLHGRWFHQPSLVTSKLTFQHHWYTVPPWSYIKTKGRTENMSVIIYEKKVTLLVEKNALSLLDARELKVRNQSQSNDRLNWQIKVKAIN